MFTLNEMEITVTIKALESYIEREQQEADYGMKRVDSYRADTSGTWCYSMDYEQELLNAANEHAINASHARELLKRIQSGK